jgi:hypothetical protein
VGPRSIVGAAPPGNREQHPAPRLPTSARRPHRHGAPSVTWTAIDHSGDGGDRLDPELARPGSPRDPEAARAARLAERLEAVLALGRQHVDGRAARQGSHDRQAPGVVAHERDDRRCPGRPTDRHHVSASTQRDRHRGLREPHM